MEIFFIILFFMLLISLPAALTIRYWEHIKTDGFLYVLILIMMPAPFLVKNFFEIVFVEYFIYTGFLAIYSLINEL